ncbi:MAG: apolipoprotein N-acyltransferase [Verrucomicrobiota bacterium]
MKPSPWFIGIAATLGTAFLHFAAFPPLNVAEAGYIFALPMLLWAFGRPSRRRFITCTFLGSWLSWFVILIWLRHVYPPWGWVGGLILSAVLALFPTAWFLIARKLLPDSPDKPFLRRVLLLGGIAGAWILLEWLRTWLLTGFPWLPLAASQWLRPAMLQSAEFAGFYGVSFILIFFNLTLAMYVQRIFRSTEPEAAPTNEEEPASIPPLRSRLKLRWRFCPEFYLALAMVFISVWIYINSFSRAATREPLINVAAVQPWIPANLKWDQEMFFEILTVLAQENERASLSKPSPDLILWPEAATPLPIISPNDNGMQEWVEQRVAETGTPLITGALGEFETGWENAVFYVAPDTGLQPGRYAKRRLVPFGEYIPMRKILFFIGTVVPLQIDLRPGDHSRPLPVAVGDKTLNAGPLICYEDIFAHLGRKVVQEGADFIVVVTNDGWYGEEAGAYQHAAHSVLRAVETRRPVVRCGNHGWSGWIDEYGNVRDVLTGDDGLVYLQGSATFELSADPGWQQQMTFYTKFGNWILWLAAAMLVATLLLEARPHSRAPKTP